MLTWLRSPGERLSNAASRTRDDTNARTMSPVASQPARGSPSRRPKSISTAAPNNGRSGTIPARPSRSRAFTPSLRSPCRSAFQDPQIVGGSVPPATEDGQDDRQPDGDLGGGDDEGEEHQHLAGRVVERPREGDEGEIHGVQHQLDAHEHDDDVPAEQQPDRTDAK